MRKNFELPLWGRHIAVAVAYGLGFFLVDKISEVYWYLPAGFRIAVLLLAAYRYWPAMVAGEFVVVAYRSFSCLHLWGLPWAIASSVPTILFVMPALWLARQYLPGRLSGEYEPVTGKRLTAFLITLTGLSLALTFVYRFRVSLGHFPAGFVRAPALTETAWDFLGDYLAAVTIVPVVLMMYELRRSTESWRAVLQKLANNSLALEGVLFGGASFIVLTAIGSSDAYHEELRQIMRILMVIPLAWMASRYGWQGAAIGTASASVGIMLTMPDRYDVASLVAQSIMATAATLLLPLGARLGAQRAREKELELKNLETKLAARRHVYQAEMGRREQAELINEVAGNLQLEYSRLLHQLRFMLPDRASLVYRDQLQGMRHQIYKMVDALSPREWSRRGLEGAIWNGPISQALDESGIAYYVSEPQGALSELSEEVKLAIFRLACEGVAYLLQVGACDAIRLRLRGGHSKDGRAWAVLSIESSSQRFLESDYLILPPEPDKVKLCLGASGMDLKEMRAHADLYDGQVRFRSLGDARWRITFALLDGVTVEADS